MLGSGWGGTSGPAVGDSWLTGVCVCVCVCVRAVVSCTAVSVHTQLHQPLVVSVLGGNFWTKYFRTTTLVASTDAGRPVVSVSEFARVCENASG